MHEHQSNLQRREPIPYPLRPPEVDLAVLDQREADRQIAAFVQQLNALDIGEL